jgi:hypothetical protein
MKLIKKLFFVLATVASLGSFNAQANVIVTWENNASNLVIRWDGFIANWTRQYNFDSNLVIMQTNNGLHALDGNVDLSWTGTNHNWYTGSELSNGVVTGDFFGSSGLYGWVYMPGNYAGGVISGSAVFSGFGNYVDLGYFTAGSRDLGFGENDQIIFQAYAPNSVPAPATIGLFGLALLAMRRFKKN